MKILAPRLIPLVSIWNPNFGSNHKFHHKNHETGPYTYELALSLLLCVPFCFHARSFLLLNQTIPIQSVAHFLLVFVVKTIIRCILNQFRFFLYVSFTAKNCLYACSSLNLCVQVYRLIDQNVRPQEMKRKQRSKEKSKRFKALAANNTDDE